MRKVISDAGMPVLLLRAAEAAGAEDVPTIVFLHGSGERGDTVSTLDSLLAHGLPWAAADQRLPAVGGDPFPFLIACPQTSERLWQHDAARVLALIDELCATERVDASRCYLTGLSMGGGGCWDLAAAAPGRFAALVPIAGKVRVTSQTSAHPPAWLFHGAHDNTNTVDQAVQRLRAGRTKAAITRLEVDFSAGHDRQLWNGVYTRADVYDWLLEQRLNDRELPRPER